jgi:hypothetical protein
MRIVKRKRKHRGNESGDGRRALGAVVVHGEVSNELG